MMRRLVISDSKTLQSVLRKVLGCALAAALGASGCNASARQGLSQSGAGIGGSSQGALSQPPHSPQPSGTSAGAAGEGATMQQAPTQPTGIAAGGAAEPAPMQRPSAETGGTGAGVAGQPAPLKPTSRPTPVSVACPNGLPQLFAGLTAQPFDAADFRVYSESAQGPQIWFGQGVLCAAATDPAACQAQVAADSDKANLPFDDSLPMFGMVTRYVMTTNGDEVHKYQSRAELLQFLGPIDSAQDALLLLYYDKRGVLCAPVTETGSLFGVDPASAVELDDGYQVLFVNQTQTCEGTQGERATLHVARDGTVTETAHEMIVPPNVGCP